MALTAQRKKLYLIVLVIGLVGVGAAYFIASQPTAQPRTAAKGELSAYFSDEFKAVNKDKETLDKKLTVSEAEKVPEGLHNWIGQELTMEEMFPGGGVKLVAAGAAAVPGPGKSAHFKVGSDKGQMSLFIMKNWESPKIGDADAYTLASRGLGAEAPPITIWRRGGLVYALVSNTPEGMGVLRQALGAPEPKKAY